VKAIVPILSLTLSIPKSPIAASIFSGLAGIASIYAGPQGFMLELAGEKEIARVTADENGNYRVARCLQAIMFMFSMCKTAGVNTLARNHSD
jgi:hypothetical protein